MQPSISSDASGIGCFVKTFLGLLIFPQISLVPSSFCSFSSFFAQPHLFRALLFSLSTFRLVFRPLRYAVRCVSVCLCLCLCLRFSGFTRLSQVPEGIVNPVHLVFVIHFVVFTVALSELQSSPSLVLHQCLLFVFYFFCVLFWRLSHFVVGWGSGRRSGWMIG